MKISSLEKLIPGNRKSLNLRKVSRSNVKLLSEPEQYARDAIQTLQSQLQNVISPKRKLRLESKLKVWEQTLSVLEKKD